MEGSSLTRAPAGTELPTRRTASQTDGEPRHAASGGSATSRSSPTRGAVGPAAPGAVQLGAAIERFVNPELVRAVAACEAAAARGEESTSGLCSPSSPTPGVWRFPLFAAFCNLLLEELEHHEAAGSPCAGRTA